MTWFKEVLYLEMLKRQNQMLERMMAENKGLINQISKQLGLEIYHEDFKVKNRKIFTTQFTDQFLELFDEDLATLITGCILEQLNSAPTEIRFKGNELIDLADEIVAMVAEGLDVAELIEKYNGKRKDNKTLRTGTH